jgi:hypothetical protein
LQYLGFEPGVGENAFQEPSFDLQHQILQREILQIIEYTELYKNEIQNILLN